MTSFSILHISDLHRSPRDPVSNDELISALVSDRDRYVYEDPPVAAPEAIVVSGDIIQGVPLGTSDFATAIDGQYSVAEAFLSELVERFLEGDRSRLIMVPGNHDIDWNTALSSLDKVPDREIPCDLKSELHAEGSDLRWDWNSRMLYRIVDADRYEERLAAFWRFFERFYDGVPGLLDVKPGADVNLFSLCGDRIGVAAYNSCHGNDCFAFHGMIRKETIARSHLDLEDSGKVFDLRMAVWHHSVDGAPYQTDYMDVDIVRGMIGRGFRLGLYGHQHKAQVSPCEIWLPDRERMAVVSAGSLCAGASELPTGVHRQYNVLEIADDFCGVRIHVRAMHVANLFSRGHFAEFGSTNYADLDWKPPRNAVGAVIDTETQRRRAHIDQAEAAVKTDNPRHAAAILGALELPPHSYERELFMEAAAATEDWEGIVKRTDPPTSIAELVWRFQALMRLGDADGAVQVLESFSEPLELPQDLLRELRHRAIIQGTMKQ